MLLHDVAVIFGGFRLLYFFGESLKQNQHNITQKTMNSTAINPQRALTEVARHHFAENKHVCCFIGNKFYTQAAWNAIVIDCTRPTNVKCINLGRNVSSIEMVASPSGDAVYFMTHMAILYRLDVATEEITTFSLEIATSRPYIKAGDSGIVFITMNGGMIEIFDTIHKKSMGRALTVSYSEFAYLAAHSVLLYKFLGCIWAYNVRTRNIMEVFTDFPHAVQCFLSIDDDTFVIYSNIRMYTMKVKYVNNEFAAYCQRDVEVIKDSQNLRCVQITPDKKHFMYSGDSGPQYGTGTTSTRFCDYKTQASVFAFTHNWRDSWYLSPNGKTMVCIQQNNEVVVYRLNFGFGPLMLSDCFQAMNAQFELQGPEKSLIAIYPSCPPSIVHTITPATVVTIDTPVQFTLTTKHDKTTEICETRLTTSDENTAHKWIDAIHAVIHSASFFDETQTDKSNEAIVAWYRFDTLQLAKSANRQRGLFGLAVPRDVIGSIGFYMLHNK